MRTGEWEAAAGGWAANQPPVPEQPPATLVGVSTQWPLTARSGAIERLARAYTASTIGGVVLTGPAGVGKTRLGEELVALSGPRPSARAVGHTATQAIPLGAFAHLLPAEVARDVGVGDDDRIALFHRARLALSDLAAGERLLLLVDDIDQLDDTSLALLVPLTLQRTLFLVATIRAGRPLPAVVDSLVKDGHLATEEVGPLGHDDIITLLHRVLDGPVETASCERLAEVSEGNLQVLREVVGLAQQRGVLRVEGGAWRLTEVPVPRALDELVRSRVEGVDADQRRALDLLAIAGTLPLDDLVLLTSDAVVEALDAEQTIRIGLAGATPFVALGHPMYGEVLRSQLGVLEERQLKRELADVFEQRRASAPEDLSRMAAWRLDSGGHVDAHVLLTAARLSLMGRDATSAVRFATAAADAGAPHDAARVLVEAAVLRSDHLAAEEAAAAVWDGDLPDAHRAHLARRIALGRFARGDVDAALAITADAAGRVTEPGAVAAVQAARAEVLASMGRPHATLEVLDASAGIGDDDPRVQVQRASARSIAATSLGRYAEAIEAAHAGVAAQGRLPEWLARRGMAAHLVNEAHAYGYSGRFAEARALVEPALAAAVDAGSLAAQLWFHVVLGEVWRDAGYGRRALVHFERAVELAGPAQQRASLVWSWVGVAQGHLLLGEIEPAAAALDAADTVGDSPLATSATTKARTRAWLLAARGDLTAARDLVTRVADQAAADGMLGFEVSARHDLVRFGDAAAAVDRLAELAQIVEGPWVATLHAHAAAVAAGDAARLDAVVDRLEAIDAVAYAAEAAMELAELRRRHGDQRGANAAERRALALVERSEGARTPGLTRGSAVVPLTGREHEVALLAAQGLTSAEIADRLVLSTRTVDTHLARVYRKLGIGGRDELDAALALRT